MKLKVILAYTEHRASTVVEGSQEQTNIHEDTCR